MSHSPMSPPSPLSPISPEGRSPPTPPEVIAEREEIARKEDQIALVNRFLEAFPITEAPVVVFLATLMTSDMKFEKRYLIASAVNTFLENQDLEEQSVRRQIATAMGDAVLNRESPLYRALNYQRLLPLTFFGAMSLVSCNYARSLQRAQAMVLEERGAAAPVVAP